MPGKDGIDAPGTLHPIICRGIERRREAFIERPTSNIERRTSNDELASLDPVYQNRQHTLFKIRRWTLDVRR